MTILDEKMAKELLNIGRNHVVIPDFVTEIGDYAFEDCEELTSVVIPNSVRKIGKGAFRWCDHLISVVIPNSVEKIEVLAFDCCAQLKSVIIPDYNGQGFLDKKILKKSVFYRSMSCHAVSPVFPNSEFSL